MTGDPSVLVVDDEIEIARAYAMWLEESYDVQTAHDGREALAVVSDDVDVVLLDRRMPRLSGDEALERIRARGYDVRVAMVTAVDPDFDVVEMPFDTYLTKPVRQSDLYTAVETLAELSEYDEAVREEFALAEKRAALEAAKSAPELTDDERFSKLDEELSQARCDAIERLGEVDHETVTTTLSGLSADVNARHGAGTASGW
jgi:DNA-binding response OmpR family regulator